MPNTNGFNYDLDLITERECVFDFVSRLYIGKPFYDFGDETVEVFPPKTLLKDILRRMASGFPSVITQNLGDMKVKQVKVNKGDKQVKVTLDGKLLAAYSDKTQFDIASAFEETGADGINNTYTLSTTLPYVNDDVIKFYYK